MACCKPSTAGMGEAELAQITRDLVAGKAGKASIAAAFTEAAPGVELKFPMYVISMRDALALTTLVPHQDLLEEGKLVEARPGMEVLFLSHQWVGDGHPDPEFKQFAVFQQAMRNLITGKISIAMCPVTAMLFGKHWASLKPEDRPQLIDSYVWYDYFGIPQMAARSVHQETGAELLRAVDSIPAYIQMAKHFFCLVPPMPAPDHVVKAVVTKKKVAKKEAKENRPVGAPVLHSSRSAMLGALSHRRPGSTMIGAGAHGFGGGDADGAPKKAGGDGQNSRSSSKSTTTGPPSEVGEEEFSTIKELDEEEEEEEEEDEGLVPADIRLRTSMNSWKTRGWCRTEQAAWNLSDKGDGFPMHIMGPGMVMEIFPHGWLSDPPRMGDFAVESDRPKVDAIMASMLRKKQARLLQCAQQGSHAATSDADGAEKQGNAEGEKKGLNAYLQDREGALFEWRFLRAVGLRLDRDRPIEEQREALTAMETDRSLNAWLAGYGFAPDMARAAPKSDRLGWSPLHFAALEGNLEIVEKLVTEAGAPVDGRGREGVQYPQCVVVGGMTPLMVACGYVPEPKVVKALAKKLLFLGADVMARSSEALTPLHFAAVANNTGSGKVGGGCLCEVLLEAGADLEAKNHAQETPLVYAANACMNYSYRNISYLLRRGADPLATNGFGMNALHSIMAWGCGEQLELALSKIALSSDPNGVVAGPPLPALFPKELAFSAAGWAGKRYDMHLLKMMGSLPGFTYLHFAAGMNEPRAVKALLGLGADRTLKGRLGQTPLEYARESKNSDVVQFLERLDLEEAAPQLRKVSL